ncbi:MAG: hypothetical protein ACP5I7_04255 [Sulfolobales archaeon]|jgi:hypothetical protein
MKFLRKVFRDKDFLKKIREFIYGATVYDLYRETKKIARDYRNAIYLLVIGEILGIPLLSNYYSLRLLPYLLEDLPKLKKDLLTEKDLSDIVGEVGG